MSFYILQISDLHLNIDPSTCYLGHSSQKCFSAVLKYIFEKYPNFENVIFTGDLSHDEQLSTYESLKDLLGNITSKCRFIPGNHDNSALLRRVFPEFVEKKLLNSTCFSFAISGWRLIGLDTSIIGKTYGKIGTIQMEWLREQLEKFKKEPTLLFVHHPPVPVHSPWLDEIGLREPEQLMEILKMYPQVKGVFSGHIHQEFETTVEDIKIFGTPSTAMQFRPTTISAEYQNIPPGFRIIEVQELFFRSKVIRIPQGRLPG